MTADSSIAGDLRVERENPDGAPIVRVSGDWTLANLGALSKRIDALRDSERAAKLDIEQLGRVDTAGAQLLLDLLGKDADLSRLSGLDERQRALFEAVSKAMREPAAPVIAEPLGLVSVLARIGATVERLWVNGLALLGFIGLILTTLARTVPIPKRWRVTSLIFHIEQIGLDAVPIVALLSFLVGAVIAFLGATVLRDFGASVFTVELVGYSFLREFGVLLTAILIAGRSGSAFTAQIGSMKAREEIDAIRTLGLDPIAVLVLPRLLALLIALPLLAFLAMLAGTAGGAAVCVFSLDISPGMFLSRFLETTQVRHFWVGISKAPIFAFLIAAIGCLEGFKVAGSAESVGEHTTSSVVQSIFVVILVDALAAIFFMEIDV
jgi:phospholipid/cholesterol/gamma-HCH transport system permease protein